MPKLVHKPLSNSHNKERKKHTLMKTTMKSSSSSFQQVATPEACFTLEEYDHVGENVPNKLGWEDIQTLSVLGSGAHSKVVLVVDEQRLHHRYALKCLDPTKLLTPSDFCFAAEDLAMEADLLSKLNHKNIVQLRGVSRSSVSDSYFHAANTNYNDNRNEGYFILLDVLEETLHDRIQRWRRDIKQQQIHKSSALCKIFGFGKSNNNNKTQTIVNHQLGRIETVAIGVADAMKYLHDNNIVVRDLKSKNVGFDKEANVRLFDFGMARDVDDCQPGELCRTPRSFTRRGLRTVFGCLLVWTFALGSSIASGTLLLRWWFETIIGRSQVYSAGGPHTCTAAS
jgi:serine/threonine protein kinase